VRVCSLACSSGLTTRPPREQEASAGTRHAAIAKANASWRPIPLCEVVGISSEHDAVAGTQRGSNTIFRFALDGKTIAHFGDFGQPALRPEQREALGEVDVVILRIGGGPTSDAEVEPLLGSREEPVVALLAPPTASS
jgi:Beta-lactamase superfamily domain